MTETPTLGLPLLEPAQAQKHVTVNEALTLLDSLVQLSLLSAQTTLPPTIAAEGDAYLVPAGAVNEWSGHTGEVAILSNGGWVFVLPKVGWSAWIVDVAHRLLFDGSEWVVGRLATSTNGASTSFRVLEFDHTITAGSSNSTSINIPDKAMVFGVTARITEAFTGSLSSWMLGVASSTNRYGSSLGKALDSYVHGIQSQPTTHYSAEPVLLTATGGDFSAGKVRIAIHILEIAPPNL